MRGSAQSDVAKVRLTDVKGAEIDNYAIAACANMTFSSSGIGNGGQEIELLTPADFRMAQSLFRRLLGRPATASEQVVVAFQDDIVDQSDVPQPHRYRQHAFAVAGP